MLELNIPVATLLQELLRGLRAITEGVTLNPYFLVSDLASARVSSCRPLKGGDALLRRQLPRILSHSDLTGRPDWVRESINPAFVVFGKDGEIVKSAYNRDNGCGTRQSM